MIRNDAVYRFSHAGNPGAKGFPLPPEGSVVTIRVLGSSPAGTRILFAGREILASGIGGFPRGADVPVRVHFSEGTVFLQALVPAEEMRSRALLSQLGLPPTIVSIQIVSMLKQLQARLDPARIASLVRTSAKFPGKESSAAEAAVILDAVGIDVDESSVEELLFVMGEGDLADTGSRRRNSGNGGSEGSPDEGGHRSTAALLARINGKSGQERHWCVFPFSREIDGVPCSGSLRFLVDALAGTVIETRITFTDGKRTQRFVLDGNALSCRFDSNPAFLPVSLERFVVYLREHLGLCDVSYGPVDGSRLSAAESVDLEA
jgi:hypothetical protein